MAEKAGRRTPMARFMVPVKCCEGAIDALSCSGLRAGPPLPRTAAPGSTSIAYPVFVEAGNEREAGRRVRAVLPRLGYEVDRPERLGHAAVGI
jgi:hypothetical protein